MPEQRGPTIEEIIAQVDNLDRQQLEAVAFALREPLDVIDGSSDDDLRNIIRSYGGTSQPANQGSQPAQTKNNMSRIDQLRQYRTNRTNQNGASSGPDKEWGVLQYTDLVAKTALTCATLPTMLLPYINTERLFYTAYLTPNFDARLVLPAVAGIVAAVASFPTRFEATAIGLSANLPVLSAVVDGFYGMAENTRPGRFNTARSFLDRACSWRHCGPAAVVGLMLYSSGATGNVDQNPSWASQITQAGSHVIDVNSDIINKRTIQPDSDKQIPVTAIEDDGYVPDWIPFIGPRF